MLRLLTVSMRNFQSYGNNVTVVNLERPGTTLIIGEDLDNVTVDGVGGNGVGKSTIINAISYALYDRAVSNISKDKLVNWTNDRNMEVILEFIPDNGKLYKVHRTRKMKSGAGGNNVYLYEDGVDITPDSAANTNKKIETIVGMPFELFVRIVVSTASHTPFLDMAAKDQVDIIEELFGLTMISEKAEALKALIKETDGRIEVQKVRISSAERENERLAQQVANAKQRVESWERQRNTAIDELRAQLATIQSVDFDTEQKRHSDYREAVTELQQSTQDLRMLEVAARDVSQKYEKNEAELTHLLDAKCPRCKQQYGDAKNEVASCQQLSATLQQQLAAVRNELADAREYTQALTQKKENLKRSIQVENFDDLLAIKGQSDQMVNKIADLETAINPYVEPLEELLQTPTEHVSYDDVNTLTKIADHQRFLLKLLTKKDSFVRKTLLNNNIPYLNTRLQHYMTVLGLPFRVEFTKELNAKISRFGRTMDFGNLSQGQRARVNLGLSFAFKDVLENIHKRKVNICMLDEVLDHGLDAVGVQAAARLVKQKGREDGVSMYIISHRHDQIDSVFDQKLIVQLSQGFSYIKEDHS